MQMFFSSKYHTNTRSAVAESEYSRDGGTLMYTCIFFTAWRFGAPTPMRLKGQL